MRRVMLLAILALALPTVALATSFIPDDETTGDFISGSTLPIPVFTTGTFSLDIKGEDGTLILQGVTLRGNSGVGNCSETSMTCRFIANSHGNFGTVELITTSGQTFKAELGPQGTTPGGVIFAGTLTKESSTEVNISANLLPVAGVFKSGTLTIQDVVAKGFHDGTLSHGIGTLDVEPVPEPGTVGMLATGLIGLGGLARRKLKL